MEMGKMEIGKRKSVETDNRKWFAAMTSFGQEVVIRDRLVSKGIDCFIPTEQRRNYRGQVREHAVISNLVFIHASQQDACLLRTRDCLPVKYLFDYARHAMLAVPDKQMEDFRRVFEAGISEGGLVDKALALGEKVRVTRGALKGVEGNVLEFQGKLYVVVGIYGCVWARARVPRAYLEKVGK